MLTWSLCVATYNRRETLVRSLALLGGQSRKPTEVVIVDSSDDWERTREAVAALLAAQPEIRLVYLHSEIRSSTTQRNLGLAQCRGDVVFILDDDSFMYADCAERVMEIYEADEDRRIAGIAATHVPALPPEAVDLDIDKKDTAKRSEGGLATTLLSSRPGRWVRRNVLFQSMDALFVKYDEPRMREVPAEFARFNVAPATFLPGFAITVRREVAEREPFDAALRYYAAFEDLDATYRYARHGLLLQARGARLHHYAASSGRIARKNVIIFQLMNMLVFLKRHAANPDAHLPAYRAMLWRRLFGEALKDILARRFGFPHAAGVLFARAHWRELWRQDAADLDEWYPRFQKRVMEGA